MKPSLKRISKSESGMATVETLPLLIVFLVLIAFTFGSFGVIHTGIMNSMAARAYAFETFRHRTNLTYFRDSLGSVPEHYHGVGVRIHSINSEKELHDSTAGFPAPERRIAMGLFTEEESRQNNETHNQRVFTVQPGVQNTSVAVNPVWVMIQYGICLNQVCGGD